MLQTIAEQFKLEGDPVKIYPAGNGHINTTYRVDTTAGKSYILQKINTTIFHDTKGLMRNIAEVTAYLAARVDDPAREVMHLVSTQDGNPYLEHDGEVWRMYIFVPDSVCLEAADKTLFYETGFAFGKFQRQLAEYPAATLHETIPDFHNTVKRYEAFDRVLKADALGRAAGVQPEIAFALSQRESVCELTYMTQRGELPLRVTHNDTKLNNVLFDAATHKALCVIDLDTIMPGLAIHDFGDAIRYGANTAAEDETDLDKVHFDLELYEACTRGFLEGCGGKLTENEIRCMPLAAKAMTMECGVRFLTDYLEGDVYFKIHRPEHNLDRCRTQFKLVQEMNEKWPEMHRIVQECRASV